MFIHIILLGISIGVLFATSITSPIFALHNWEHPELWRLLGIFVFTYCLQYICKRIKTTNIAPAAIILLLLLIYFDVAAVFSVALLGLTAAAIGRRVAWRAQWSNLPDIGMHLTIGYAVAIGFIQIASHFKINFRELYLLLTAVILFVLNREVCVLLSGLVDSLRRPFKVSSIAFTLPFGVVLSMLIFVSFPETHSDALNLNLRIANQMSFNGIWSYASDLISWAVWPKGAAWLFTPHVMLGGESGARLCNGFAVLVTALLIYRESERLGFSRGWLTMALFLSTPITFWISFVMFDDAVFGMFTTAAIIFSINSSKNISARGIFITLLLCSAAMATKMTGLFILPVVGLIYSFRLVLERSKYNWGNWDIIRPIFRFAVAFTPLIVIGVVPYVFMYIKTGNPIFPLYNDIFKAQDYPFERFQDLRWSASLGWNGIFKMAANTSKYIEGGDWTFGVQHALFFIPLLIEFIYRRKNIDFLLYGMSIIIFSLLLFSETKYVRYLYPVFPIYALLIGGVFDRFNSRNGKYFIYLLSIIAIGINLLNVKSLNMYYKFDYKPIFSNTPRRFVDYFEKSLAETVNLEAGRNARVLYIHRAYSAELLGTALNDDLFSPSLRHGVDGAKNTLDAINTIKKYAITYIISDEDITKSTPTPFLLSLPKVATLERQVGSAQLWKIDALLMSSGETVELNSDNKYVLNCLNQGWRTPEKWGIWAKGNIVRMPLRIIDRDAKSSLLIDAMVLPYTPPGRSEEIKIEILANGHLVQDISLQPEQIAKKLSFNVPAFDLDGDNVVNLDFKFSKPFDESQLQVGFSKITVNYDVNSTSALPPP
jgi:hypothetical protein